MISDADTGHTIYFSRLRVMARPGARVTGTRPTRRLLRLRAQSWLYTRGSRSWEKVASRIKGAQKYVLKFQNFCGYQKTTGIFMCGLRSAVLFILTRYFQRWVPGRGRGMKVSRGPRIAWCRRALWLLSYESPAEIFIRRREHIPVNRCLTVPVILTNECK